MAAILTVETNSFGLILTAVKGFEIQHGKESNKHKVKEKKQGLLGGTSCNFQNNLFVKLYEILN